MPPKKEKTPKRTQGPSAQIENAGVVVEQLITDTIEKNFMPYAMSVILSRAIPEIDGFKPSHRKLLYTMYKMGLLTGARTKSANVVGQTMRLNPHGDAAIYETMVRLSRGYEALLHPYVDSKGNFGKSYSRDMAYAASRYTEVKLDSLCSELFGDIDRDTVDFVDNYDSTTKEPTLLPVSFPSVLVNANTGIAVGMASSICPFNLGEVCETTIQLIQNPEFDITTTLHAPDFPGGGYILYDRTEMGRIYASGRGGFKVRCRYIYDKAQNCIEVTEIPPTTTVEAIIDKIVDLVKQQKIKEISDLRDETDLSGLKLTIDLKRGVDPDKLMQKLYRTTPLEDTFSCNFNILVGGMPRVMGVQELLMEWVAFRQDCVKRRIFFDLSKKQEKLHLLRGLAKILLDIDKAIHIVRETQEEREVVPNLMIGFGIDEIQADYVAEIRLRQLNREYILKRTEEIASLETDIAEMEGILKDVKKIRAIIVEELRVVMKKHQRPRKSILLFPADEPEDDGEEEVPNYPVNLFFTREGYFKKITPQSLRMSSEQKLKEGDEVVLAQESQNIAHLLFFTDQQQVYKARVSDFEDTKASVLGDFIPAKLGMDEGENVRFMVPCTEYTGQLYFAFQNGKVAKVDLSAYETKTRRKKLLKAYSDKSPLAGLCYRSDEGEMLLVSSGGRMLIFHTTALTAKATKDTQGVAVMTLRKNQTLASMAVYQPGSITDENRYKSRSLPAAGSLPKTDEIGEQLTL